MNTRTLCSCVAGLALVAGGATASTRDVVHNGDGSISVKVGYTSVDLASEAGGLSLLRRIRHAARTACDHQRADPWLVYSPCVGKAVDKAVAQLGNPMLTALNNGKAGDGAFTLASR